MLTDTDITRSAGELLTEASRASPQRYLLGIAGVPGSGKSTLAQRLCDEANAKQPDVARVVPMDGFHLPNEVLAERGLTDRKGAPETFDAIGFIELIRRCRNLTFCGAIPIYDRDRHEPVVTGKPEHRVVTRTRLVIAEGNYLLLDIVPWSELRPLFDARWFLRVDHGVAERWLVERHRAGGKSPDQIAQRMVSDRANSRLILERSAPADRVLGYETPG